MRNSIDLFPRETVKIIKSNHLEPLEMVLRAKSKKKKKKKKSKKLGKVRIYGIWVPSLYPAQQGEKFTSECHSQEHKAPSPAAPSKRTFLLEGARHQQSAFCLDLYLRSSVLGKFGSEMKIFISHSVPNRNTLLGCNMLRVQGSKCPCPGL